MYLARRIVATRPLSSARYREDESDERWGSWRRVDIPILGVTTGNTALLILDSRYRTADARSGTNDCRINYDGILTFLGVTDVLDLLYERGLEVFSRRSYYHQR